MRVILLTRNSCPPCDEALDVLKDFIQAGEIEIRNTKTDTEAANLAYEIGVPDDRLPQIVIVSRKTKKIFGVLPIKD